MEPVEGAFQQLQALIDDLRWVLVVVATFFGLAIVAGVVTTVLRLGWWRTAVLVSGVLHWRQRHRWDGKPYPPAADGICGECGYVGRVFHLPNGQRLCPACYRKLAV